MSVGVPSARARPAARPAAAGGVAPWFVALLSAYCLAHLAVRLLAPGAVQHDEAEQLLLSQSVAAGYGVHPPLYTWLQRGFVAAFGPGVFALALLKSLLLFGTYLFTFLSARLLLGDDVRALLAAFSLSLLPPIGWEAHRDLSHSVLATSLAAASVWVLLRLLREGATRHYVILGLLLGLAALAKYHMVLFGASLVLAVVSLPGLRGRLLDRRMLLGVGVAALVLAPHLVWLAGHLALTSSGIAEKLRLGQEGGRVEAGAKGVLHLIWATLLVTPPLVSVFFLFFPRAVGGGEGRISDALEPRRLLARFFLVAAGLLALAAVLIRVTTFEGRWLGPFLLLLPLYLFLRLPAGDVGAGRLRRFGYLLAALAVVTVLVRVGEVWAGPRFGIHSRLHIPFAALAEEVRAAGFAGGTIVAENRIIGGNLRLHFPDARVLTADLAYLQPPARREPGQCLVVWNRVRSDETPAALERFLRIRLEARVLDGYEPGQARARLPGRAAPVYELAFMRFPRGIGTCR